MSSIKLNLDKETLLLRADYLKEGLKNNSVKQTPNFNNHFIDVLPKRSILTRITEVIVKIIPFILKPLCRTGAARREIKNTSSLTYNSSSVSSEKEKRINLFNLTAAAAYDKLTLNNYQRQALIDLLNAQPEEQHLQSIAAKYLNTQSKYTITELSVHDRWALDEINLKTVQNYFIELLSILNDPESYLYQYAQQQKTYHYKNAMVAEILSKSLAYNDKINQREIALPVDINGTMKFVNYKIEKKYLGNQLPYYVFMPLPFPKTSIDPLQATDKEMEDHAQAWIVIRGTEPLSKNDKEGVLESLAADVKDTHGVSPLPIWQKSAELLELMIKIKEKTGKKINLTGHSLGGTLSQSMAVIFNPLINQTFGFNSPGVSQNIFDFAKQLDKQNQHNIVVFHSLGDMLSSVSPKRIGQNFEIKPLQEKKGSNLFTKHSDLLLNDPHQQAKVDVKKDELNLMRRFSEWNRRSILSKLVYLMVDANHFGWFRNRKELQDFSNRYLSFLKKKTKT